MNWTVEEFLDRFKAAMALGRYTWDGTERRFQELADLQLTFPDVRDALAGLDAKHHVKGPEPDDVDFDCCTIHKFRLPLDANLSAYVKIGVKAPLRKQGVHIAKVWSFKRWTTLGER